MNLSAFKISLSQMEELRFSLTNGHTVPAHFHVSEIAEISKKFIDCGGVVRNETKLTFQLWYSEDFDHRITPEKLLKIIDTTQKRIGIGNHEIEVEYQLDDVLGSYELRLEGSQFLLSPKEAACLAPGQCDTSFKPKVRLSTKDIAVNSSSCTPGSGCC